MHEACLEVIDRAETRDNVIAGSAVLGIGITVVVGIAGLLLGAKKR